MKVTKKVSPEKRYQMPNNIRIVRHKNHILVIAPDTAKWLVLENEEQLDFFHLLEENKLSDALNLFQGEYKNAQQVVLQLEARRFEDTETIVKVDEAVMQLYITNSCNLRCPHCYMFAGEKAKDELTLEEIEYILSNYKKYGGQTVVFTGGEVCMRPDFYDIVKYAHEVGLDSEILTNGLLWTDEMIERFAPLVSRVQISIDGYSEEENSKVRGPNNLRRALETIDKFLKRGVLTDIGITPLFSPDLKDNYQKYVQFAQMTQQKYAKKKLHIRFTSEMLDGRAVKLTREEKLEYKEIMNKIINESFVDYADIPFINFHKMNGIEENCNYGNLTIACNGDVYFCPQVSRLQSVINLRTTCFEEIASLAARAKELSNVNNLQPCKECELKHICGGDCRINFFEVFKTCDVNAIKAASPTRQCNQQVKEEYYDVMIRTNEKLYQ